MSFNNFFRNFVGEHLYTEEYAAKQVLARAAYEQGRKDLLNKLRGDLTAIADEDLMNAQMRELYKLTTPVVTPGVKNKSCCEWGGIDNVWSRWLSYDDGKKGKQVVEFENGTTQIISNVWNEIK